MQNRLKIINATLSGITLAITLLLIRLNYSNIILLFTIAICFMLITIVKDIGLGKFGFDFSGFGLKKMLIWDFALLILMVVFLAYKFV